MHRSWSGNPRYRSRPQRERGLAWMCVPRVGIDMDTGGCGMKSLWPSSWLAMARHQLAVWQKQVCMAALVRPPFVFRLTCIPIAIHFTDSTRSTPGVHRNPRPRRHLPTPADTRSRLSVSCIHKQQHSPTVLVFDKLAYILCVSWPCPMRLCCDGPRDSTAPEVHVEPFLCIPCMSCQPSAFVCFIALQAHCSRHGNTASSHVSTRPCTEAASPWLVPSHVALDTLPRNLFS